MKYQYSIKMVLIGILICAVSVALISSQGKSSIAYTLFYIGFGITGVGVLHGWIRMIYLKLLGKKIDDDYR